MLKNMIKMEKPQMCFLQETKCNSSTLGDILSKAWPGCRSVAVDAMGASGGLAIAWNSQAVTLTDFHASHHLIQAVFHILGTNIHGNLSNVYFPQDIGSEIRLLDTIEALNNNRSHPLWIVAGDFNMITSSEEKIGGRHRLEGGSVGDGWDEEEGCEGMGSEVRGWSSEVWASISKLFLDAALEGLIGWGLGPI